VGFLPDFCMLPAEDLGVKKAVLFCRRCLWVCLAANLDALPACERNVLGLERLVERVQVQRWWHFKQTIIPHLRYKQTSQTHPYNTHSHGPDKPWHGHGHGLLHAPSTGPDAPFSSYSRCRHPLVPRLGAQVPRRNSRRLHGPFLTRHLQSMARCHAICRRDCVARSSSAIELHQRSNPTRLSPGSSISPESGLHARCHVSTEDYHIPSDLVPGHSMSPSSSQLLLASESARPCLADLSSHVIIYTVSTLL